MIQILPSNTACNGQHPSTWFVRVNRGVYIHHTLLDQYNEHCFCSESNRFTFIWKSQYFECSYPFSIPNWAWKCVFVYVYLEHGVLSKQKSNPDSDWRRFLQFLFAICLGKLAFLVGQGGFTTSRPIDACFFLWKDFHRTAGVTWLETIGIAISSSGQCNEACCPFRWSWCLYLSLSI